MLVAAHPPGTGNNDTRDTPGWVLSYLALVLRQFIPLGTSGLRVLYNCLLCGVARSEALVHIEKEGSHRALGKTGILDLRCRGFVDAAEAGARLVCGVYLGWSVPRDPVLVGSLVCRQIRLRDLLQVLMMPTVRVSNLPSFLRPGRKLRTLSSAVDSCLKLLLIDATSWIRLWDLP